MKRRHSRDDVLRLCDRLRALRPDIAFGADLIAGFPTETEAMFANTLALVEEADLTYLHVFPYSARRARRPRACRRCQGGAQGAGAAAARGGRAALGRFLERQLGRVERVLVERGGAGRTEAFAPFRIEGERPAPGSVLAVRAERMRERHPDRAVRCHERAQRTGLVLSACAPASAGRRPR